MKCEVNVFATAAAATAIILVPAGVYGHAAMTFPTPRNALDAALVGSHSVALAGAHFCVKARD